MSFGHFFTAAVVMMASMFMVLLFLLFPVVPAGVGLASLEAAGATSDLAVIILASMVLGALKVRFLGSTFMKLGGCRSRRTARGGVHHIVLHELAMLG